MVHKFQEQENYDAVDPTPYQGGYDQAARYGSLKPADKECGYRRSQFGLEEPVVQYGKERNPYARIHPGPSIYGGSPKPGAVYGGGRDRAQPSPDAAQPDKGVKTGSGRRQTSPDEAQPDKGVKTGSGRRQTAKGKQQEPSCCKPSHSREEEESGDSKPRATYEYEVSEESGYRKLISVYDQEEQRKPAYGYGEEESGYRQPFFGFGEAESSNYRKPQPTFSEVDQYGFRKLFYGYGYAESGYHNPYHGYGEEDSGYRKSQPIYNAEDSVYRRPYNEEKESKPGPIISEQEAPYAQSTGDEGAYGGYGYAYGYQPNHGEEASGYSYGYGHGYGGYGKKFADDDPAQFGGGSSYVEEPVRNAPAPAYRSSWW